MVNLATRNFIYFSKIFNIFLHVLSITPICHLFISPFIVPIVPFNIFYNWIKFNWFFFSKTDLLRYLSKIQSWHEQPCIGCPSNPLDYSIWLAKQRGTRKGWRVICPAYTGILTIHEFYQVNRINKKRMRSKHAWCA